MDNMYWNWIRRDGTSGSTGTSPLGGRISQEREEDKKIVDERRENESRGEVEWLLVSGIIEENPFYL